MKLAPLNFSILNFSKEGIALKSGFLRVLILSLILVAALGLICSDSSAQVGPIWYQSGIGGPSWYQTGIGGPWWWQSYQGTTGIGPSWYQSGIGGPSWYQTGIGGPWWGSLLLGL